MVDEEDFDVGVDLFVVVFVDVFLFLNYYIVIKFVILEIVDENCFVLGKEEKEIFGRLCFDIFVEMLEELCELGFSWIKIGEMLGVLRWMIYRRVE